ncbi:histone family protein [Methanobrevibacter curvatus]|uniref:Histone-like transcription factor (CBF/NF-Y) and archaeal histone n=1 Tax=Methanobrevibacter curvatus TaxID=49547 RepID=A0A166BVE0_9EURY|nr:histone [Methanobrevibacter curvatus]KZX13853.1 histone-like transcription factor (CBF/NF-Y) and archaeal histone [Methanobrevibacter curvatus]
MAKNELPLASVARLLKNVGAQRISDKAVVAYAEVLEEAATKLSIEAVDIAKNSGRKTIKDTDIKLALASICTCKK